MTDDPREAPRLDHAVIGNGRVLALVAPSGAIEWLCLPRFDSPSIFARLLDSERGGVFRVLVDGEEPLGELSYMRNTNVSRIVVERGEHAFELIDFAPRLPEGLGWAAPIELCRLIRPLRGAPRIAIDFDPRPDYARAAVEIHELGTGLEAVGGGMRLEVASNVPTPYLMEKRPFVLDRPVYISLAWQRHAERPSLAQVQERLAVTVEGWRIFARTCALPSFAPDAVLRSALCLKLHAYHDTGAIIAATTTSIPEALGTERTWDYRYCWLRDAAFVIEALRRLGQLREGQDFVRYLRDVVAGGPLQPLYGIGGERDLEEHFLPHLAGYGGNGFVRIGNAAYTQRQHDLMGELVLSLECLFDDPRLVVDDPMAYFPLVEGLVEQAIVAAPQPDTGIWEFRTKLRPYTFSRAMCWAAIERGARIAERLGFAEKVARWRKIADAERETILSRAWSPAKGYFTQALDGEWPDAANLLLPVIGIVDARDPRFVATVEAYERELVRFGLMLRYRHEDDFGETTSAFTICSFWWAEALALMGRLDEARAVFEHVLSFANPVGLFSEDLEPATGRLLGNFPQAYTHVGLIHAAMTLGALIDARDGLSRAWS